MTLVAVKAISTGPKVENRVQPGEVVWDPENNIAKFRYARIIQLYRRGMLGPEGNQWTDDQIAAWWIRVFNDEGRVHRDHAKAASSRADEIARRLHRATADFRAAEESGIEGAALEAKSALCEATLAELTEAEEEISRCRREWAEWADRWRSANPEAVARVGTPEGDAPALMVDSEEDSEEEGSPLEPVKDGNKWIVPGHEGETFNTKKAAKEYIDGLDEGDG